MTRRSRLAIRPRLEILDIRCVLSALTPVQLQTVYGLNAVNFTSNGTTVKGDGTGQTIAIIDAYNDPNAATELATFDAQYGLPTAKLTVDNLGSASNTNTGWEEEEALDIEYAHVAAPGATIVLVEAKSDSLTDLLAGVTAAKAISTVSVVSMSWGGADFAGETAYDSIFTTPIGHTGITFLASSGDSGAGAQWPADSPNVVGVGGTSLVLSSTGTRASETAWSGSGGGTSSIEPEPSYQLGVQSTGHRTSPDVSAVADPNTGVPVYSVAGGGYLQVGGTSLSSPIWAGLIAITDQGRVLAGKTTLDGPTQTLPDLYAAASTSTGSFTDVTSGSRATTGYDTSTGLGTPNATTLVAVLVADPAVGSSTVATTPVPVTGTGTGTGTGTTGTGTGTTTGGGGTTTPPRRPWQPPRGGWWNFVGGSGGYDGSGPASSSGSDGWATATVPKNGGQGTIPIPRSITPVSTTPNRTAPTPKVATRSQLLGTILSDKHHGLA